MEVWVKIKDFPSYECSNYGRIKSAKRDVLKKNGVIASYNSKIIKPIKNKDGYNRVVFYSNNKRYIRKVHKIIAEHFLKPIKNKEFIYHLDEDKTNNMAINLKYISHKRVGKSLGKPIKISVYNKLTFEYKTYNSILECSKELDISYTQIGRILNNENKNKIYIIIYI